MEITKTNNIITFKESVSDKKEVPVSLLQEALLTKYSVVVIIS